MVDIYFVTQYSPTLDATISRLFIVGPMGACLISQLHLAEISFESVAANQGWAATDTNTQFLTKLHLGSFDTYPDLPSLFPELFI